MVQLVGEKRRDPCCRTDGVVVCEVGGREAIDPVILLLVEEETEVGLGDVVDDLCLSVGLGVGGRRW